MRIPKTALPCLLALMSPALSAAEKSAAPALRWISSTETAPWQELPATPLSAAARTTRDQAMTLDANTTFQLIDGFGGCFNDLGWQALLALDEAGRDAALKELFDPAGANFTLARAPIGANDFSLCWYSLSETAGDFEMARFSIDRDRHELIPYIKAAMNFQPRLRVWGVPWSPPSWMKTNGHYKGGFMKQDPKTLAVYALYFSRYVQSYRQEGIDLYAIMPQNEPCYNNNIYPQCVWNGAEINGFLRDYLAPRLKKDGVAVELWLGTLAKDADETVDTVLRDPATRPLITGVAVQYDGQTSLRRMHENYPGLRLMQSETECFNGLNSWDEGMTTFRHIIEDTANFAGSYFYWNTVLNESGNSSWNWRQNSLVTVDRRTDAVRYNPEFYSMKHFSATVMPGARRIAVSGGPFKNVVAFLNPAGTRVIVFANDSEKAVPAEIDTGSSRVKIEALAKSMNTVIIPAN